MTLASAAEASETIRACVRPTGLVRILRAGGTCTRFERPIEWNAEGPQGPPGAGDPTLVARIQALETQLAALQQEVAALQVNATLPELSIQDVTVNEGNCVDTPEDPAECTSPSSQTALVTAVLSKPSSNIVNIGYEVVPGTAQADDFIGTPPFGTLSFLPGETTASIPVLIDQDFVPEVDETIVVRITSLSNANAALPLEGVLTIANDDRSVLFPEGRELTEGDSGTATIFARVCRPSAYREEVSSVDFETVDGTAEAGSDYLAVSGTLQFSRFSVCEDVTIPLLSDTVPESEESFTLRFSNPVNTDLAMTEAIFTILDNDATLSVSNTSVVEGNTGDNPYTIMEFVVTLDPQLETETVVAVGTGSFGDTARSFGGARDYVDLDREIVFPPGSTAQTVEVLIIGDTVTEADETLTFSAFGRRGASPRFVTAIGTIVDDDS